MDINRLAQLYIFESVPGAQSAPEVNRWWRNVWGNVQQAKLVPYAFASGFRLTSDATILFIAVLIGVVSHAPGLTVIGLEILYIGTGALLLYSRTLKRFLPVVGAYLAVIVLGGILNLFFPGKWGSVGLCILCVVMFYRFPPGWSLPLAALCIVTLITTNGALQQLSQHQPTLLLYSLLGAGGLCWFGWTQRRQYLLIVRLHETQEQLRQQMARSEALATEQERTRIARDIHDVLSHSLAVLSIQVQAARQLLARDPERLATKLDDMAALIRESITESRRVVGLLREQPLATAAQDDLGASLRSIATTFNERTGIHCRFEESGTSHRVDAQQRETLQLALREILTNAHRHGSATTVWITLRWEEADICLQERDDGSGANVAQRETIAEGISNGAGDTSGHHGLQGMRERAAALGGEVEAGLEESGGFLVTMRLPYEQSHKVASQKVTQRE